MAWDNDESGTSLAANGLIGARLVEVASLLVGAALGIVPCLADNDTRNGIVGIARVLHELHVREHSRDSAVTTDGKDGARLEAVLRRAGAGCCEAWGLAVLRAGDGEAVVVLFLPAAKLEFGDGPVILDCTIDDWGSHGGRDEHACEGSGEGDGMHFVCGFGVEWS